MGADGGTVAKRSEIVGTQSKDTGPTKLEDNTFSQWTNCAMSGEKLRDPVVSDWNGNIYNKTAVLSYLIGTGSANAKPKTRISRIRDVVELQRVLKDGIWLDSISRKDLALEGMSEEFGYLAECGHISPVNLLSKTQSCPECERGYTAYTILNPRTQAAMSGNQTRIEELAKAGFSHSLRKCKPVAKKRSLSTSSEGKSKSRRITQNRGSDQ